LAHAYTPGLKVTARTTIRKRRMLPLEGNVLVQQGQQVAADGVIAEAALPGPVHPVNVVNRLGIRPEEIRNFMVKKEGESVRRDEPLAETRPWLRWLKTVCSAPVDGVVESISEVTGQVMLREPPQVVAVRAYVAGTVVEVLPKEGAVVEAEAALVQGIFGVGGECSGVLRVLSRSPDEVLGAGAIGSECRGCIIVIGAEVTAGLVKEALAAGAAAVVAGGMSAEELRLVLGRELGVAVTGSERIGLTVVLTEGFGRMAIAERTFALLKQLEGRGASACGATQIRAGVVRPEVVVPLEGAPAGAGRTGADADGLREGDRVRIIRQPHFGLIGEVVELVPDRVQIETEAKVRVLRVRAADNQTWTVPRANVEIIKSA